jgi:hypothetical protein
MSGHMHQPFLDAIQNFIEGYGKDERYRSVMEGLRGVVSGLGEMGPQGDGAATPGQVAAKLAADPDHELPVKEAAPEAPAGEQPKSFADATAAAKERMVAAR